MFDKVEDKVPEKYEFNKFYKEIAKGKMPTDLVCSVPVEHATQRYDAGNELLYWLSGKPEGITVPKVGKVKKPEGGGGGRGELRQHRLLSGIPTRYPSLLLQKRQTRQKRQKQLPWEKESPRVRQKMFLGDKRRSPHLRQQRQKSSRLGKLVVESGNNDI
ncbi:hypothetical protein CYMTET_13549 [Cymbomonas tetramitiformis]|uniref:Uncharacterized protein n=1 Tax=Cymbomonas tetramitiformis TaxID=36881 RepID=A0AAE0GIA3_9CHLO|nr:hypothetical protein CYMTET_13549 [Cymbomonas tetramitiformis]